MALIAMSGTSSQGSATLQEMQDYRDKLVSLKNKYLNSGFITPGSQEENQYIMAIDKVTKAIQFASISGVPIGKGIFSSPDEGGIDWGNIFGKLIDTGASLIQRNNQPSGGGMFFPTTQQTQPDKNISQGINLNTILLVAGAGLGLYLILRKR
jgi:hypothetical protein